MSFREMGSNSFYRQASGTRSRSISSRRRIKRQEKWLIHHVPCPFGIESRAKVITINVVVERAAIFCSIRTSCESVAASLSLNFATLHICKPRRCFCKKSFKVCGRQSSDRASTKNNGDAVQRRRYLPQRVGKSLQAILSTS